jgi:hypothetical protein
MGKNTLAYFASASVKKRRVLRHWHQEVDERLVLVEVGVGRNGRPEHWHRLRAEIKDEKFYLLQLIFINIFNFIHVLLYLTIPWRTNIH